MPLRNWGRFPAARRWWIQNAVTLQIMIILRKGPINNNSQLHVHFIYQYLFTISL